MIVEIVGGPRDGEFFEHNKSYLKISLVVPFNLKYDPKEPISTEALTPKVIILEIKKRKNGTYYVLWPKGENG